MCAARQRERKHVDGHHVHTNRLYSIEGFKRNTFSFEWVASAARELVEVHWHCFQRITGGC